MSLRNAPPTQAPTSVTEAAGSSLNQGVRLAALKLNGGGAHQLVERSLAGAVAVPAALAVVADAAHARRQQAEQGTFTQRQQFGFAVNAGHLVAVKLAQLVVGATPDGRLGPVTLGRVNETAPEVFIAQYTLAKIARYRDIVTKDRTQLPFLLGWLNRVLKEAA